MDGVPQQCRLVFSPSTRVLSDIDMVRKKNQVKPEPCQILTTSDRVHLKWYRVYDSGRGLRVQNVGRRIVGDDQPLPRFGWGYLKAGQRQRHRFQTVEPTASEVNQCFAILQKKYMLDNFFFMLVMWRILVSIILISSSIS